MKVMGRVMTFTQLKITSRKLVSFYRETHSLNSKAIVLTLKPDFTLSGKIPFSRYPLSNLTEIFPSTGSVISSSMDL